jgi:hypothetical protein
VSRSGGEVVRSNEVGYAVVLPSRNDDQKPGVIARGLALLRAVTTACDRLRPVSLTSATHRACIESGRISCTIHTDGPAMDGDPLHDCAIKAAGLADGQILVLGRIRPCFQSKRLFLTTRANMGDNGLLIWL